MLCVCIEGGEAMASTIVDRPSTSSAPTTPDRPAFQTQLSHINASIRALNEQKTKILGRFLFPPDHYNL